MERIRALLEGANWIPFLLATGAQHVEHRRLNFQRLLEVIITGIISGAVAVMIAFYVLKNDVGHLTTRVNLVTEKVEKLNEKFDNKVNGFVREFDQHSHTKLKGGK